MDIAGHGIAGAVHIGAAEDGNADNLQIAHHRARRPAGHGDPGQLVFIGDRAGADARGRGDGLHHLKAFIEDNHLIALLRSGNLKLCASQRIDDIRREGHRADAIRQVRAAQEDHRLPVDPVDLPPGEHCRARPDPEDALAISRKAARGIGQARKLRSDPGTRQFLKGQRVDLADHIDTAYHLIAVSDAALRIIGEGAGRHRRNRAVGQRIRAEPVRRHQHLDIRNAVAIGRERQVIKHKIAEAAIGGHIARALRRLDHTVGELRFISAVKAKAQIGGDHLSGSAGIIDHLAIGPYLEKTGELSLRDGDGETGEIGVTGCPAATGGTALAAAPAAGHGFGPQAGGPDDIPRKTHGAVYFRDRCAIACTGDFKIAEARSGGGGTVLGEENTAERRADHPTGSNSHTGYRTDTGTGNS